MRVLLWLLLAAVLILTGIYPGIAVALGTLVALAATGLVALLMQPPILITGLLILAAAAVKRRRYA